MPPYFLLKKSLTSVTSMADDHDIKSFSKMLASTSGRVARPQGSDTFPRSRKKVEIKRYSGRDNFVEVSIPIIKMTDSTLTDFEARTKAMIYWKRLSKEDKDLYQRITINRL